MEKLFKQFHLLTHPLYYQEFLSIINFMAIVRKAQEIIISNDVDQLEIQNLSPVIILLNYCFLISYVTETQLILLIFSIFILNLVIISSVAFLIYHQNPPILLTKLLQMLFLSYSLLLQIPTIYLSLSFIYDQEICNTSNICTSSTYIVIIICCIINFISAIFMTIINVYFGRCERLQDENIIHPLDQSILITSIYQLFRLIGIIFKIIASLQQLRLAFMLLNTALFILINIRKFNYKKYLIIEVLFGIINVGLSLKMSLYDLFLAITLLVGLSVVIIDHFKYEYLNCKDQQSFSIIQNIEQYNQQADKQSKLLLSIIQTNHKCLKCKNSQSIPECILRRMSNTQQNKQINVVLYCNYISNHSPLKALVRLILQKPDEIFFKHSFDNLASQLYRRAKQYQKEAIHKYSIRNTNEHSSQLNVQSAYLTSHSANLLFPLLIETIQSKINFWSKLINGYSDIEHYLEESLKTTNKMLDCKKAIEDRFDLAQNKLKFQNYPDIITMRIIQIYYSAVYANSFQAYQIEKSIEELIKNERYKQDESLDNMQLVQNRLVILKSSLVRKRGELINVNAKQLSQFFNDSEESFKQIKHCNQLMPGFIQQIHEKLMDNYLQRGHSKLMINGESSFCQAVSGYIEQVSLNLFNFFDDKDDFILNMIITKQQTNTEFILFAIDGRILGMTKIFYEQILQGNMKMNSLHQQNDVKIAIKDFLIRNPLIQFYIPSITNQVQELRQQIQSSSNYQMTNLKSLWVVPTNHVECLQNSQLIFSQFKKRSYGSQQNFRSYKSVTYSKYSQNTLNTQYDHQYDDQDISADVKNNISINNIPILILHPDVETSLSKMIDLSDQKQQQIGIYYNLQFKTLNYKRGVYGYFMLTIKDFKTLNNQQNISNGQQTSRTQQSLFQTFIPSQELSMSNIKSTNNSQYQDIRGENLDYSVNLVQEIRQMNNLNFRGNDNSSYNENSYKLQLKQSDRSNIFDSSRQPLFARPKVNEVDLNEEVDQIEQDMNGINEFKIQQIEDEQEDGDKKVQSISQSVKKNTNILMRFQTKQTKNKINDFASNPSKTSTNSTSKESLLIVQQLYHNTQLITPLKKISVLLFLICSGVFICNILNIQLISNNLIFQVNQLATLRQPQNINYFYTSEVLQEWYLILINYKLVNLSPFLYQRNLDTLQGMYDYARTTLIDLAIEVPLQSKQQNLDVTMNTKFFNNNSINTITYPLEEFYSIMYQTTEISYRQNLNNGNNFTEILSTGVVRLNILDMIDFHNRLIQAIISNTIDQQSSVKSYFLSIMIGEMFSIFFIIGVKLRYWLFIDHIIKSILFLVSRLNENQAFEQISRLSIIKEQLEKHTQGNWKLFNFGEVMYELAEKKQKKVILKSIVDGNSNNIKATSALYSRIQRTYYLNRINALITFILTIFWTVYLMAGFLLHMSKNDNFQPSLTVTLKFVQFRHNMDSLSIIAGLIKTEPLIPNYNLQSINQTKACQLLVEYRNNLSPLINEVAQVILENANANKVKSRFDTILNYDLCLSSTSDALPFCDLSTIKLQYYPIDNYLNVISNGALGYNAALLKFIDQEFDYEMQNLQYRFDYQYNLQALQSQAFQNFILQYFSDIQTTMRQFLVLFQEDNLSIANNIISIVQVYYLGFGICLFLSYVILSIIWVYKQQKKIQSLRQILVLIPPDHILTTNVRSQAKNIHQMLY